MKSHHIFNIFFVIITLIVIITTYTVWIEGASATTPPVTGAVSKPRDFVISLPWASGRSVSIVGYAYSEQTHMNKDSHALDFGVKSGTGGALGAEQDIYAIAPGKVVWASAYSGQSTWKCLGSSIVIAHTGSGYSYTSFYAHLAMIDSKIVVGASVTRNQKLGIEGNSGSGLDGCRTFDEHLHFVLYKDADTGTNQNPHPPGSATSVVPEPFVGEQVYEGFGLRWNGHMKWPGPLTATNLDSDSIAGPPSGNWGNGSTINGSVITLNQPVVFTIDGLATDTKEVRFTAGYADWSAMDDQTDNAVWRILVRCWPNKQQQGCQWSNNNSSLTYEWVPHRDNFQSNALWLPQGGNLVHRAFNDNGESKRICISFDVFDLTGNSAYSPGGTQCTPAGGSDPFPSENIYLPLIAQQISSSPRNVSIPIEKNGLPSIVNSLDNTVRSIYIAPADIPTPTPAPSLPADAWYVNYYNDLNLGSGSCNPTTLTLFDNPPQRTFVFKDWGDNAPHSGCNGEFSARIWRRFHLEAGNYTFHLYADDKARLELLHAPGGNLIIDQWNATQHIESRTLPAGDYEIVIQYQDSGGAARVHAWWDGPGFPAPPRENRDLNQWHAAFWPNTEWFWDAFFFYNDGNPLPLNKQWQGDGPGYGLQTDNFSSKYERIYPFSCGDYRFILNADDYAELDVWDLESNTLVHHLVTSQANIEVQSNIPIHLSEKKYEVKVKHKEYDGGAQLYVNWILETPCPTSTPQPALTWTPTNTPQPTLTWTPIRTPVLPTNTPQPTLTNTPQVIPTKTNTPTLSSCNTITQIPQSECNALEAFYNSTDQVGETDDWFTTTTPCVWRGVECSNGHITKLLLEDWYIHGAIAPELGNLTELEVLDLSDNNVLAGNIPPELGRLSNLRILRLDRNELTGGIPSELGNLTKLEELSLYTNPLNGALPIALSNIQNIKLFWFYDTGLCILSDTQFQNWLNNILDIQGTSICNTPPSMPASVQAIAISSTQIQIIWFDTSNNENQFTINEGSTSFIVSANTTSYVHSGLAPNTYHCYSLSSANSYGSSAWTDWSCTATMP